jgi:type I restriction enzyme R subunit
MIATGTDIKPLECVLFMRAVKSRTFFEQMKGRGVRIISPHDLQAVTPDAKSKDHFVIVDAVGVCERDKTDSRPMDQKKSVSFEKLLQAVALGNTEPEVLSSVAARLARLDKSLSEGDKAKVAQASGGATLKSLAHGIVAALNPDESPNSASLLVLQAVKPLCDPKLRNLLIELKQQSEQLIDTVTQDQVIEAGFSAAAKERAKGVVESFERFIAEHKDEITALQILYNRPQRTQGAPLTFEALKTLADALQAPPRLWTESQLWQAYAALDKSKVKGENRRRILTDLVSLVRFAMHQDNELVPFPERVAANFKAWRAQQEQNGKPFTPEQRRWLEMIRDHIAANLGIEADDFELSPFAQEGGIGKVHQLFGTELPRVLIAINQALVA